MHQTLPGGWGWPKITPQVNQGHSAHLPSVSPYGWIVVTSKGSQTCRWRHQKAFWMTSAWKHLTHLLQGGVTTPWDHHLRVSWDATALRLLSISAGSPSSISKAQEALSNVSFNGVEKVSNIRRGFSSSWRKCPDSPLSCLPVCLQKSGNWDLSCFSCTFCWGFQSDYPRALANHL